MRRRTISCGKQVEQAQKEKPASNSDKNWLMKSIGKGRQEQNAPQNVESLHL